MQIYYYVLASDRFLEEEPIDEVLTERIRNYHDNKKTIDFWLVKQPAFLAAPEMAAIKAQCPPQPTAIISTNPEFITWLKLRLEYVLTGQFSAPSSTITDPLASIVTA